MRISDWSSDVCSSDLATFGDPAAALAAAEKIMAAMPMDGLSVHAGLHFGTVIATAGDIFGDAVNLTARLASMANAGWVLISGERARPLPTAQEIGRASLRARVWQFVSFPVDAESLTKKERE